MYSATTTRTPRDHVTTPRRIDRLPLAIAHRGASAIAPENTLLAYRLAVEFGVDALEVDARLTRDGVIVLLHDADLSRTTNGTQSIEHVTYKELQTYDAGYWFCPNGHPSHPFRGLGITIPTLGALIEMLDRVNPAVELIIEIKNSPLDVAYDPSERLAECLVNELRERDALARCCMSSFGPDSIDRVKRIAPGMRTAYLAGPGVDVHAKIAYAIAKGHNAIHVHENALAPAEAGRHVIGAARRAGLEIVVWVVNERGRMSELQALGVDGIMSDDPERLRAVLNVDRSLNG